MTVIERWTVYVDPSYGGKPVRQPSPREADRFGFEAVEVVPADQLQGAVETLALIRTTLEGVDPHDDKQSTQVRVAEALRLLGALPSPSSDDAPKETDA